MNGVEELARMNGVDERRGRAWMNGVEELARIRRTARKKVRTLDIRCENYRTLRTYLGFNKAEFAKSIFKSSPYSSLVERGQLVPSDKAVEIICDRHHINMTWFTTGEGAMFLPGEERPPFDHNTLGNRIRTARKETRLTVRAFAEPLNISGNYLSNVESGNAVPSMTLLRRMANEYQLSLKWLTTGQGDMHYDPDEEMARIIKRLRTDEGLRKRVLEMIGKD